MRFCMVKNNLAIDLKIKCLEEGTTQAELADKAGTSASYVSRLINNPDKLVNKVFIELYESLGYDLELHYVKKEGE